MTPPAASEPIRPAGWLPEHEFRAIYARVPRLCVEVVLHSPERGTVLSLRDIPPNIGAWHIPGGTVLFGEPVVDAVRRVARYELELEVEVGELIGYVEYPSHYENGIDSPVGLAFRCSTAGGLPDDAELPAGARFFTTLPDGLYAEQRAFLTETFGAR
jgi:ADP-ribose pyrophosphatase YjhB (NUDIX family)